uniref:Brix domain-containing protein n=1 Tax=Anas platyrhynchos TaxID=8839 RepID=A0A8B9R2N5_ANAPL
NVRQLILDVRKVMEPYTARALKVRKKNSMKDFVAVAGPLGVTHFLVFSKSTSSINFKLFRLPGGPTLTFKVMQVGYSLIKDVVSSLKRHRMHEQQFTQHPTCSLHQRPQGEGGPTPGTPPSVGLVSPPNSSFSLQVNLNNIKRCLLISYDAETQLLDFRHYKGLKKLLQEKFPNMSRLEDISELDINLSESEAEQDGTHNILELPQAYAGRGNMKAQQSAVRLTEIGPRMTLQLVKVEEGLAQGNVLFHSFIHKTEEEVQEILARKEAKLKLKTERRQQQEAAVERKSSSGRLTGDAGGQGRRRKKEAAGPEAGCAPTPFWQGEEPGGDPEETAGRTRQRRRGPRGAEQQDPAGSRTRATPNYFGRSWARSPTKVSPRGAEAQPLFFSSLRG